MLSYRTVESRTLALLKKLSSKAFLSETRLVGGTALALFYGCNGEIEMTVTLSRVNFTAVPLGISSGLFSKESLTGAYAMRAWFRKELRLRLHAVR